MPDPRGSSWNHSVRHKSPEEIERSRTSGWHTCRVKGCFAIATHECSYDSVTGRAGRVNRRAIARCGRHARAFIIRAGLDPGRFVCLLGTEGK